MAPGIEAEVQARWLGAMQLELGVLKSNHQLMEIRCEALQLAAARDAEMIEALKARALRAEENVRALQEQIEPARALRRQARRGRQ